MPGQRLSTTRAPKRLRILGDRQGRLTHASGKAFARLVDELHRRPNGWALDEAAAVLEVSAKTLGRYIAGCNAALTDVDELPRLVIVERRGRKFVRFRPEPPRQDTTLYEAAALKLALTVFRVANGTVFQDLLAEVWDKVLESMPDAERARLADVDRKFFAVPYLEKTYAAHDARLDRVLKALVEQRRLRIDYLGLSGTPRVHAFDPYTLTVYRGGLYLVGRSHLYRKVLHLAVERMREVRFEGTVTFAYPRRWSPAGRHRGLFGIIDGDATRVTLRLRDADTARMLRARRLGLGERFAERGDGTTLLTLRVRGVDELANWILGFGAHVEVLGPRTLRHRVATELALAVEMYRT